MNWIFKVGDYLDFSKNNAVANFEQKTNFSGKLGENVLILEKIKNEWQFISQYTIESIIIKNPEAEYKNISISLIKLRTLKISYLKITFIV
jgi:hypothetical protein